MTKSRKPLEGWQKEDASRLKKLFEARKPKISQMSAASEWGIGETQGIIWQYLNGQIPLNLAALIKFSKHLPCSPAEISPTLTRQLEASDHAALIGAHRSHSGDSPYKDEKHEQIIAIEKIAGRLSESGRNHLLTFAEYLEHRDKQNKPKKKVQTPTGDKKHAAQSA